MFVFILCASFSSTQYANVFQNSSTIFCTIFLLTGSHKSPVSCFLVLVRRVTLFQSELVNFSSQRCQNFLIFNHHTATLKWIRKSLDFLRKKPLTAYEFEIIRKSITNRKSYPFILLQNRRLEIRFKTHSKAADFRFKNHYFFIPAFILFIHQKCISKYRKSYLQCRSETE